MNKELFEMKKYVEYLKIGFKTSIEYKSYILGALITPAFMGFFFYFIWSYIYDVRYTAAIEEGIFTGAFSNFTIGGFTFEEMLVYLLIGLLFSVVRSTQVSEEISEKIRSGDISIFLCRPVSFIKSIVFQSFGAKIINLSVFGFLLVAMTFVLQLPTPPLTILMIFLLYAVCMIIFDIFLYVMIGGLSFWFVEIWGIRASIEQVLWILSGRVLPLTLFPQIMQTILVFTPFLYLEFTFASLYLGKLTVFEALRAMGIFTLWITLMGVGTWYLYKKGFEKVSSFGG
ncbi:MAG: ABC-2 family transporter protein [Nanoarchaeota archaeon]|nr:ABC-2 family transporter protein [Nanoarchaeota archaeon]